MHKTTLPRAWQRLKASQKRAKTRAGALPARLRASGPVDAVRSYFGMRKIEVGKDDEGIPEKMARGYFERFADPKKIEFYKAGHALNDEARPQPPA